MSIAVRSSCEGHVAVQRKISPGLTVIDAPAMVSAIHEFNELGRTKFLKKYGVSRSSKFYLIHEEQLYDTKALVAAAYHHKTGQRLRNTEFGGGAQTKAVFDRLDFASKKVFKDTLGELRNLSNEYDRIPRVWTDLRELGFSKWISLAQYSNLKTGRLPGVYVIARANSQPVKMRIDDKRVVYIGETVSQNLTKRLQQFKNSIDGKGGSSGGDRLHESKMGYCPTNLWASIKSFSLQYGLSNDAAKAVRSAQIRSLERILINEYVHNFHEYPAGNFK